MARKRGGEGVLNHGFHGWARMEKAGGEVRMAGSEGRVGWREYGASRSRGWFGEAWSERLVRRRAARTPCVLRAVILTGGEELLYLLRIAEPAVPDFLGDRIRGFSLAEAVLLRMILS
jgi:hypothetical protein